ncbi:conserved hypothetical protein [Talaromyces stipitatus ATCC 10500]|uniref:GST N-terminal domain-containing protein n=1 Tax=Talaromyces stipitatus (strain ATCC 10500 / CBS 375.48 / QM 6759 / NRRL 1006) TaxID=441959 RepID=B8M288_TALSN|nr:uncharacterized protein TSTA_087880 [Talaromyces stipitatus ATCC 10500]EED21552.1 conserved hypothetical protein [Talaromyces stipitatus ATCC 10500]
MTDLANAEYTLYSSPFSLYSMMARHTIQLGRTTHSAKPPKDITLKFVNRGKEENLSEYYLTKVNPKGQVPAMTGNVLKQPLTDSISISLYLAENHYPDLLPDEHAAVIKDLLQRFHSVYGLSFSNKNPTPEMIQHNPSPVEDFLKRTDISPEYRKALEAKLKFHNENNGIAFHPDVVAKARADLRTIFAEIIELRRQSGALKTPAEWIFGNKVGPTVLDSHMLPLVLRCIEVGNAELVPQELQLWAKTNEKSPTWEKVMHGRPTRYDPSMGPVEDMHDMMSL